VPFSFAPKLFVLILWQRWWTFGNVLWSKLQLVQRSGRVITADFLVHYITA